MLCSNIVQGSSSNRNRNPSATKLASENFSVTDLEPMPTGPSRQNQIAGWPNDLHVSGPTSSSFFLLFTTRFLMSSSSFPACLPHVLRGIVCQHTLVIHDSAGLRVHVSPILRTFNISFRRALAAAYPCRIKSLSSHRISEP